MPVVSIITVLNNLQSHLPATRLLLINLGNICYRAVVWNTLWVKVLLGKSVRVFFPEKYAYVPWLWVSMCTSVCARLCTHVHTHSPLPPGLATWSSVLYYSSIHIQGAWVLSMYVTTVLQILCFLPIYLILDDKFNFKMQHLSDTLWKDSSLFRTYPKADSSLSFIKRFLYSDIKCFCT